MLTEELPIGSAALGLSVAASGTTVLGFGSEDATGWGGAPVGVCVGLAAAVWAALGVVRVTAGLSLAAGGMALSTAAAETLVTADVAAGDPLASAEIVLRSANAVLDVTGTELGAASGADRACGVTEMHCGSRSRRQ